MAPYPRQLLAFCILDIPIEVQWRFIVLICNFCRYLNFVVHKWINRGSEKVNNLLMVPQLLSNRFKFRFFRPQRSCTFYSVSCLVARQEQNSNSHREDFKEWFLGSFIICLSLGSSRKGHWDKEILGNTRNEGGKSGQWRICLNTVNLGGQLRITSIGEPGKTGLNIAQNVVCDGTSLWTFPDCSRIKHV